VVSAYLKLATIAGRAATSGPPWRRTSKCARVHCPPAAGRPPAAAAAAKADFLILEEKFKEFQGKSLRFTSDPKQCAGVFDTFTAEAQGTCRTSTPRSGSTRTPPGRWLPSSAAATFSMSFAQKLIKGANNPPDEVKRLSKKACAVDPSLCGVAETEYKDASSSS